MLIIRSSRLCCSMSLQPGHYSSLTAPYLQHTANQERYDQCGNQQHSPELLMMSIVMLETCWGYKKYNKITSGIYKSYCCTVHFCRITSIINQQMHLPNFHIKHLKSLRHVSILSDHHQGAVLFLAKVVSQYSQFNSFLQTKCCGSMSCCVAMCCRESSWLGMCHMIRNEGPSLRSNMTCCHNTMFAKTNWIVNIVIQL